MDPMTDDALHINAEDEGRLDKVIAGQIEMLSRARVQALIDAGHVALDGEAVFDRAINVHRGQEIDIVLPDAEPAEPKPESIPLQVVYEDKDILVVNKPAGLVVHPGAGNSNGTLVNALLGYFERKQPGMAGLSGIGGVLRPGIVHRLDKGTSGLMVVAKNDKAHHSLTDQFSDRSLSRTYLAIVQGLPTPPKGRIETLIGRNPKNRQKMAVVRRHGKSAVTMYDAHKTYWTGDGKPLASVVECALQTGRTHQIRVHMTHIGCPVVGDPLYSRSKPNWLKAEELQSLDRQALHACALKLRHPSTDEAMTFECSPPADFRSLADHLAAIGCDNS